LAGAILGTNYIIIIKNVEIFEKITFLQRGKFLLKEMKNKILEYYEDLFLFFQNVNLQTIDDE